MGSRRLQDRIPAPLGASGGVVLDGGSQPIKVQKREVTFVPVVISCLNFPRASCNPVIDVGGTGDWVSNAPGQNQVVDYFVAIGIHQKTCSDRGSEEVPSFRRMPSTHTPSRRARTMEARRSGRQRCQQRSRR